MRDSCDGAGGVLCRAIIPHPVYFSWEAHVESTVTPVHHHLDKCPVHVLDLVAEKLDTARDLVSFAAVCKTTRHAFL